MMIVLALLPLLFPEANTRERTDRFTAFSSAWEVKWDANWDTDQSSVTIKRDKKTVLKYPADNWMNGKARLTTFPVPYRVLAVRKNSGMGHGQETDFFRLTSQGVRKLLTIHGEPGGPIFRDFDHDGVDEWVFDDYHWYTYYGDLPKWIDVYKLKGDVLVKWKRFSNRAKLRMEDTVGFPED